VPDNRLLQFGRIESNTRAYGEHDNSLGMLYADVLAVPEELALPAASESMACVGLRELVLE
jgi:hypothetical protein